MNRRAVLSLFAAAPLAAATVATTPTEEERAYLIAASGGPCEGTFDCDSDEAIRLRAVCDPMVERGWLTRHEGGPEDPYEIYTATPLGKRLAQMSPSQPDQKVVKRLQKGTLPWGEQRQPTLSGPTGETTAIDLP